MDRLAGTVDAAFGINESVERFRGVAALDASVGEIEGRLLQIDEIVIGLAIAGDNQAGRQSAGAARQAGREMNEAGGVGFFHRQHFIVLGDQPYFHAILRRRRCKRADENRHAVGSAQRGQAKVGNDEPLGRAQAPGLFSIGGREIVRRAGPHHINAGLRIAERLQHRKSSDDILVEFGFDGQCPRPDFLAVAVAELAQAIS